MLNSCWLPHYRLALYYASTLNKEFKFDIVHNTWLSHYQNHDEDLFNVDYPSYPSYLYQAIKWAHNRWIQYEKVKSGRFQHGLKPDNIPIFNSPLGTLVAQDLYEQLYQKLYLATAPTKRKATRKRELALKILKLLAQGNTQKDVAEQLNTNKQQVHYYTEKIRELMSINPFRGSTIEVNKVITENAWEKRTDQQEWEEDDSNEFYRVVVHSETKEGLLIRLRTPERNPYIK